MPLAKLNLPPGVSRNGTLYQQVGRWFSANLVRWSEGVMQPIGGWQKMALSNGNFIDVSEPIRGIFTWRDDSYGVNFLYGTPTKVYHMAAGAQTDLTPLAGFTTGIADATLTSGYYDQGTYDKGPYGTGDEGASQLVEATSWQFDNYGQIPVALCYSDGKVMDWDLNTGNNFAAITNAPTSCVGVVVTPERMIVALGAGGDGRYLKWCDQTDRTIWTPASTNTAGDYSLPGQGSLMCGKRLPTETLLLSDSDAFAMRYIGGTLIYRVDQVGTNCGAISRLALTTSEGRAFWMGKRSFFVYEGGFARAIPCPLSDDIFPNLNQTQRSKIAAWANSRFHEVWFAFPSAGSLENDKIVAYNYLENHWSGPWDLERTCGSDAGPYGYPFAADSDGAIYDHERGFAYLDTDDATALVPSAESGPFELGAGDVVMQVREYIPDADTVGSVDVTLLAGLYPHQSQTGALSEDDRSNEDSQVLTLGARTDARLTGRYVRLKIEQDETEWRFGAPRLEVIPRGRR